MNRPCRPNRFRLLSFLVLTCGIAGSLVSGAAEPVDTWSEPHQEAWHWKAMRTQGDKLPWKEAFVFEQAQRPLGAPAERWFSLQPVDESLLPSFYDVQGRRLVTLAASARVLCSGAIVDKLLRVEPVRTGGLHVYVSFSLRLANGAVRRSAGYGDLDEQGHWTLEPAGCDSFASDLHGKRESAPSPGLYPDVPGPGSARPRVKATVLDDAPGLLDLRSGRWLTPRPPRDVVAARWDWIRRKYPKEAGGGNHALLRPARDEERSPGEHSHGPIVIRAVRAGHVWIVTATADAIVRDALMDDQGRWLIPVSEGALR